MSGEVVGLVTARGGSKGIPGKNIAVVAGKPLIAWTIEAGLNSSRLGRIIVSTDDEEIARTAMKWGAEVPFIRPQGLSQDDTPHIAVVEHAFKWFLEESQSCPDYIMTLQPTSPLRTSLDIDKAVDIARTRAAIAVVSVCETAHHPYLAKTITEEGILINFVEGGIQSLRRQDLPRVYALNGAIYLNRIDAIGKDRTMVPKGTYAYIMPPDRSLDVDTPWDLYLADLILRDKFGAQID